MSQTYGGQAVIEGVMIRGARAMAIAVRRPDGTIALRAERLGNVYTGTLRRIPLRPRRHRPLGDARTGDEGALVVRRRRHRRGR